jgi:predicted RND superfamily exporter protein
MTTTHAAEYPIRHRLFQMLMQRRRAVIVAVALVTALAAWGASGIRIATVFSDLLPERHPYVEVNNQFARTFGGANVVSIMLSVEEGDIFRPELLERVQRISRTLVDVEAVDPFQINSLTSRKAKNIRSSTEGLSIVPLMYPDLPTTAAELVEAREAVLRSPLIYGPMVSHDLRSTLITVDFFDQEIDYGNVFDQIEALVAPERTEGIRIAVAGDPVLFGWIRHFLGETLMILLATIALLAALLLLVMRTWYGTLLPLLSGLISALWSLAAARWLGMHLDPLAIVVAFLITGRAISNSVQMISRFDAECRLHGGDQQRAAQEAFIHLFKPSMLSVIADAGCVLAVMLTPIPLLKAIAIIGSIWLTTLIVSVIITIPLLLSVILGADRPLHRLNLDGVLDRILSACGRATTSQHSWIIVAAFLVAFGLSAWHATDLTIGDANPGSPILWQDSVYNQDAAAINSTFAGADRMFLVTDAGEPDAIKRPEVLADMAMLQRYMEAQPEVGGSLSFSDVLPVIRKGLYEGNPRYEQLGRDAIENGELTYMVEAGSDPGDMDRFMDPEGRYGSITLFFRDHQGDTIRTAVHRLKNYLAEGNFESAQVLLAGGVVGMVAAVNEVILAGQIEAIAVGLLIVILCSAVAYGALRSGLFFMVPVLLSNTMTFSFMTWKGIGMSINTLPVVALGIGLGVDYAFYVVDGVSEELKRNGGNLGAAVRHSLMGAGRGVLITGVTLIGSAFIWMFSSLRLQAEMGILIAVWLTISVVSALLLMPALIMLLKPAFIVGTDDGASNETWREGHVYSR